jgi:hypothetical protein
MIGLRANFWRFGERCFTSGVGSQGEPMLTSYRLAIAVGGGVIGIACATVAVSAKGPIAPDTVVCTSQENLDVANLPAVAKSEIVLRALGCRRSDGTGVRNLLRNAGT